MNEWDGWMKQKRKNDELDHAVGVGWVGLFAQEPRSKNDTNTLTK